MSLVFGTPHIIDQTKGALADPDYDYLGTSYCYRFAGPIAFNSALWIFSTMPSDTSSGPYLLSVYRSIDGITWVEQDIAHAPVIPGGSTLWKANIYWDGTSSTVTIAYIIASTSSSRQTDLTLIDFDMSTGLFGSTYGVINLKSSLSTLAGELVTCFYIFKLSSGIIRLVYQLNSLFTDLDAQQSVFFQDYTSGSWGAEVRFPSEIIGLNQIATLQSAFQDGDLIHCVYSTSTCIAGPVSNNDYNWRYVAIQVGATFSAEISLNSFMANPPYSGFVAPGVISGSNIMIPFTQEDATPSIETCGVLLATPSGAPATAFTYIQIGVPSLGLVDMRVLHQSAKDTFCWNDESSSTSNDSQFWTSQSTSHGATWSTPYLSLSLDVTPPTPIGGKDTLNCITLSLGVDLNGNPSLTYESWAQYYPITTSVTPTISLSCNGFPNAYIGVFYSHALLVTGGTPPFLFDLIEGSLPPGLSLDPFTGVISGTPANIRVIGFKTFTFTIKVTDANGLTATVTCSILIYNYLAGFPCN